MIIFAQTGYPYVRKENTFRHRLRNKDRHGGHRGQLDNGPKRPSELHRLFADANARVIDQQLKELEKHGAIRKKIYAELPPHSEYSITDTGRSLIPVIKQLETWGDAFRPKMKEILGIED